VSTHRLIIAPAAKSDLNNIYQYGLQRWGKNQANNYLTVIKEQLWSLTEKPLMGMDRSDLLPDARSLTIKSHAVFYRVASSRIEIIRVRHGRQSPRLHVK
jgi:toxin ParE1/3/4